MGGLAGTEALGRRRPRFFRLSAARTRIGAARLLRRRGDSLSEAERDALQYIIDNPLAAQIISEDAAEDPTVTGQRDWAGFLEALADFLERILPFLMDLVSQLSGIFGGLSMETETDEDNPDAPEHVVRPPRAGQ